MEEELNENELEERLYAMLYHVDETQTNVTGDNKIEDTKFIESVPQSTLRRYWRTSEPSTTHQTNTPETTVTNINTLDNKSIYKDEKCGAPTTTPTVDLSIFQTPVSSIINTTIEVLENDDVNRIVELNTSDEDEVIEVALPPKPTITIESSDDEEPAPKQVSSNKNEVKSSMAKENQPPKNGDKETSPVPSIVSSVSDDFIRGDCIALNISSRRSDNPSFDFSLHGSDLLGQSTPTKKKKRKKAKDRVLPSPPISTEKSMNECFAAPKNKVNNKKQQSKSYVVSDKSIPNADVYDSDSNQSLIYIGQNCNSHTATDKSTFNAEVCETHSNLSVSVNDGSKSTSLKKRNHNDTKSSDSSVSLDKQSTEPKTSKRNESNITMNETTISIVDLTDNVQDDSFIEESIVMGNVSGFTEFEGSGDEPSQTESPMFGSTKVPAILYEDLDFDNLKGKDKVCRRRRYSLTTLRAEMEKFYNESWGGEDFNHREIQKSMSRDKSLWMIDPKDRMPSLSKKKVTCNYCNRPGHRDDTCRMKPPVCYMCGSTGHFEPRCPSKICVNCGMPNIMYSTMCRNCSSWGRIKCNECGQNGHPSSHCPDLWRRYHNTINDNTELEENHLIKKYNQQYCSGCTRRGHLVHTCRLSLPFSGLPINSPYVSTYSPVYTTPADIPPNICHANQRTINPKKRYFNRDYTNSSGINVKNDRNKRQSKSPTVYDDHSNKRRNVSSEDTEEHNPKSPIHNAHQRKTSVSEEVKDTDTLTKEHCKNNIIEKLNPTVADENVILPDFIPINSTNHDKKGQIIQDNEVSDTSDAITLAGVFVTNEVIDKLKTKEGEDWLNNTMKKYNVTVQHSDIKSFLSVKGKIGDQEAFHQELKDWVKNKPNKEQSKVENDTIVSVDGEVDQTLVHNMPKNRNCLLRKLNNALDSLKQNLGDPNTLFKDLNHLQDYHQHLLKQKIINPQQLSKNRANINQMLRKLNMVLLGQAGLAHGSEHLSELYTLQGRLTSIRSKHISTKLREEIGEHYQCIFTPMPRDDYVELLRKYYISRKSPALFKNKKKKENCFNFSPKSIPANNIKPFSPQKKSQIINKNINTDSQTKNSNLHPLVNKTMNKLVLYHKRILRARPLDAVLKKTRLELVRILHTHIASLNKNNRMSSKALKKMKKVQVQARLFLSNV